MSYAGNSWGGTNDVCNYIENGSMTLGWNGDVSPCWPLMHSHTSYLHGKVRRSQRHISATCANAACVIFGWTRSTLATASGCKVSPSRPAPSAAAATCRS